MRTSAGGGILRASQAHQNYFESSTADSFAHHLEVGYNAMLFSGYAFLAALTGKELRL